MAGKSDYLEDKILNHVLRNTSFTVVAQTYLALLSAAPSDTGGGTELSGNAYARQAATFSAPSPSGTCTTSADIFFPVATGSNWAAATHFGVYDASTSGNLLYWGTITSVTVAVGEQLKIAAGALTITED